MPAYAMVLLLVTLMVSLSSFPASAFLTTRTSASASGIGVDFENCQDSGVGGPLICDSSAQVPSQTPGLLTSNSGSARAVVDYGLIGLNANGRASRGFASDTGSGQAVGSWDDPFTVGALGGGMGVMTLGIFIDGFLGVIDGPLQTAPSSADGTVRAKANINIGACTLVSGCVRDEFGRQIDMSNGAIVNDISTNGINPVGLHVFTFNFTFGVPVPFDVMFDISAIGSDGASATARFSETLEAGIIDILDGGVSILDSDRNLLSGYSFSSNSGHDYTKAAFLSTSSTVPEPAALLLFCLGLAGVAAARGRRPVKCVH